MFSPDVMQRLGFEPDGSNSAVRRTDRHELRLTLGVRVLGMGQGAVSVRTTRLDVRMREPIRELFHVYGKGTSVRVTSTFGVAHLDRWLDAQCVEPFRIAELAGLGAFDVLGELSPMEVSTLRLDDDELTVTSGWPLEGGLLLGAFVGWGERVVERLRETVLAAPLPAWRSIVDRGWASAATTLGGEFEPPSGVLSGTLHGLAFRAVAMARDEGPGGWWTACKVDVPGGFAAPGQPDAIFTWEPGKPPPALAVIRSGAAPKLLALLPRVTHVQLRAGQLRVSYGGLISEPNDLDAFVRACVDAALELSVPDGDAPGPYR